VTPLGISSIAFACVVGTTLIFLLLELNSPFDGAIRISRAPMRDALTRLGR
jgi:hypothetical protein